MVARTQASTRTCAKADTWRHQMNKGKPSMSCTECRNRKTKCCGRLPCTPCQKRGLERKCEKYSAQRVRRPKGTTISANEQDESQDDVNARIVKECNEDTTHHFNHGGLDGLVSKNDSTQLEQVITHNASPSWWLEPPDEMPDQLQQDLDDEFAAIDDGSHGQIQVQEPSDVTHLDQIELQALSSAFYESLPDTGNTFEILEKLRHSSSGSHSKFFFDFDVLFKEAQVVCQERDNVPVLPLLCIPVERAFFFTSTLIFANASSRHHHQRKSMEKFEQLCVTNEALRQYCEEKGSNISLITGCRIMSMALIWASRTDVAANFVQCGLRCAITRGLHIPAILALQPPSKRAPLLDCFLHLASEDCLFHAILNTSPAINPSQIDLAGLLSVCPKEKAQVSRIQLMRFQMHAKAMGCVERFHKPSPVSSSSSLLSENMLKAVHAVTTLPHAGVTQFNSIEAEILQIIKQPLTTSEASLSDDGDPISSLGMARFMLLLLRFFRILLYYPLSNKNKEARLIVWQTSRSIFGTSWSLANSKTPLDGTTELYALMSLQCMSYLEQYKGDPTCDVHEFESLTMDLQLGQNVISNLSKHLRMGSSALQGCQRVFFSAV